MNQAWIAPSILSADFARLGEEVTKVLAAGASLIHIDVMDHHYVPNLTFGPLVVKALRDYGIQALFDVHLMVKPVDVHIKSFAQAGANYISFHPEATEHPHRTLQLIREMGCKSAIALNPATPLSWLEYLYQEIDMVLLMSVNPGFGGQKFIPEVMEKIRQARNFLDERKKMNVRLEVDGGINLNNIGEIARAGADTFVAGSAIFSSSNYQETIQKMFAEISA